MNLSPGWEHLAPGMLGLELESGRGLADERTRMKVGERVGEGERVRVPVSLLLSASLSRSLAARVCCVQRVRENT